MEHFSLPLPVRVICELLGVPPEDQHIFHAWSNTIMSDAGRDPAEIRTAMGKLGAYFGGLIANKRATPADDLMTALTAARDEEDRLTEKELVNLCYGGEVGRWGVCRSSGSAPYLPPGAPAEIVGSNQPQQLSAGILWPRVVLGGAPIVLYVGR